MFLFGFPAKTMGCVSKLVLAKAEGRGFGWFVCQEERLGCNDPGE